MADESKKHELLDLIDIKLLQNFQDAFANTMNLASLIVDDKGPVTKPSNFTDFCIKYTRGSALGLKRCNDCDIKWGQLAAIKQEPVIYKCHTGLIDFAVPIIVAGKHIGSILCGQVLTEPPNEENFRNIARQLGIDEDLYLEAVKKVPILPMEKIQKAANLLFTVGNAISEIGMKNYELIHENERETLYGKIIEAIRSTLDIKETKKLIVEIIGKTLNADRCFIVDFDKNANRYKRVEDEYLSSESIVGYKGSDVNSEVPAFAEELKKGKQLLINNKQIFIRTSEQNFEAEQIAIEKNNVFSAFAVPLYYHNEFLGVLSVHYVKKHLIEEKETELINNIAGQVAVAIYQSKLYNALKLNIERERFIGKIITKSIRTFDLSQMKSIVEELGIITRADRCYLVDVDFENKKGKPVEPHNEYRASDTVKSIVGYDFPKEDVEKFIDLYIKTGELIVFDYQKIFEQQDAEMAGINKYAQTFNLKKGIGIPYIIQNKLIGVLAIEYVEEKTFSDDEINFLKMLLNQIKLAYNQIQLYHDTKKAVEREKLIRNIIEIMHESLDSNLIKQAIVNELGKAYNVDICFIMTYQSEEDYFFVDEYSQYLSSEDQYSFINLDSRTLNVKWWTDLFKEKKEVNFYDLEEYLTENGISDTKEADFTRAYNLKSSYNFAIHYANKMLGYLTLEFTKEYMKLPKEDLDVLRAIATQAGIAIHQSEMYRITQRQVEREKMLRTITETIRSTLNIEETKSRIVNIIGQTLNADRCFIMDYDKENNRLLPVKYEYLSTEDIEPYKGEDVNSEVPNFIERALKGEIIVVNDKNVLLEDPENKNENEFAAMEKYNVYSILGAPIFYNEDFLGVLAIHYVKNKHIITEDEVDIIKLLSNQISIAIHQANLYKITKAQAEREKISRNMVEILRSTLDRDIIISLFVQNIGKYFNADRVLFSDYDERSKMYMPVKQGAEFLSSPKEKSFVGYDWSKAEAREYIEPLIEKRELNISCWDDYIKKNQKGQDFIELFETANVKSSYNIPVLYQDKIMGYFCIEFTQEECKRLSDEDIIRIRNICMQVGIAIYHSEMYKKAQETARLKTELLEKINEQVQPQINDIERLLSILRYSDIECSRQNEYLDILNENVKKLIEITKEIH